ncbi:hypothetical protein BGZ65_007806 [Modicella reniformis]|uniref:Chitin-binding type-1 domain-containing protein n=1 Tax=Modicella reniformis TaxID=1440133 RepID=A0A9P6IK54_9FUNG|nr:hypothetical protein BGZ65_007806 [Modicella reniformis]
MLKKTFVAFAVCSLGLLSLVNAQACGFQNNNQICPAPNCCSSNGFCGNAIEYCGTGCQVGFGAPCHIENPNPSASTTGVSQTPSGTTPLPTSTTNVATTTTEASTITTTTTFAMTSVTSTTTTTTTTTSSRGTMQLQPTGKPSGAARSQDKSVESRLALMVVLVGLIMV